MRFSRRAIYPIMIGSACTLAYYVLNFTNANNGLMSVDQFYGEQFFSVLSTLYAVTTALILVKGLEAFDALSNSLNLEALQIRSVNSLLGYFPLGQEPHAAHIARMRQYMRKYANNILSSETVGRNHENSLLLNQCIDEAVVMSQKSQDREIIIKELIAGLEEWRTLRASRVHCASVRVPPYLVRMLALMTVTIVLPFYLQHDLFLNFNYYAVFVLSTFGSFVYFMLLDINKPYEGLWTVDRSPFRDTIEEIDESLQEAASPAIDAQAAE